MSDIDPTARYILTNQLFGSSRSLASNKLNDSLIVVSSSSDSSQAWYFTTTPEPDYYYLHTVQKGALNVLDIDNYYGGNSIDMHFYYIQPERTAQYWRLSQQDDGSVKISNNFTGPDMFLDIDKASLQPTLKAQDSPGQRWTLNSQGLTTVVVSVTKIALPTTTTMGMPTSISVFAAEPSTVESSTIELSAIELPTIEPSAIEPSTIETYATEPSATQSSSTCAVGCSVTTILSPQPSKLSNGSIAGIAVGSAAVLGLLIGALLYWRRRRKNKGFEAVSVQRDPMSSRPILHG